MSVASDQSKKVRTQSPTDQGANAALEAPAVLITDYISNEIAGSVIYMSTSTDNPLHEQFNLVMGVS